MPQAGYFSENGGAAAREGGWHQESGGSHISECGFYSWQHRHGDARCVFL
ncbi:hypothetical protein IMCC9480_3660 [Oxalobacteraceae bacterium IMCC9480]|nr:hypothetical protein IMCC9480_3660 [Oxalobacteraceae bacterium IMCC9480]